MLLSAYGAAVTFWFFALFCLIGLVVVYKMVPETKGKSLEQIQEMWVDQKGEQKTTNKKAERFAQKVEREGYE